MTTLILVGIGGTLAFAMEVAEFAIVQIASSLTLSIIGVTKVHKNQTISLCRIFHLQYQIAIGLSHV